MMVLSIIGIEDGPTKYHLDAAILAGFSAPILYVWGEQIQTRGPRNDERVSDDQHPRTLEALERQALVETLRWTKEDRTRAARLLGGSRATIYRALKRFGIEKAMSA